MRSVSKNENGTFSLSFHGDPGHVSRVLGGRKPGDFLTIKLPYQQGEPLRDTDGRFLTAGSGAIRVAFSKDVRIENVTLFASPGMGFVATGSEGMVLDRYRVMRKPQTDRLASTCSDGAHFKSVSVMPKLSHCYFEAMMDDAVNVKISSARVLEKNGRAIITSDAHKAGALTAFCDEAEEMLKEIGFKSAAELTERGFIERKL
jgi:hypothetical protein